MVGERLRNHPGLVVVCTAAAAVEALLVGAFAPTSSLGLATQVTAPPPFGVFHDLRWIVVYHESWIGLACELLAFVVFRSLLTALCLRAAWPYDIPPEPWALTIRRSVLFTVIVGVLLAPWAALMFALAVVSLSWLFFVAIPVVLMLALLVHGGAVTGSWWSRTLSVRSLGWVLVAFVALSGFGSIMTMCPVWARVPVAMLAGFANAWLWLRVVETVLHPDADTSRASRRPDRDRRRARPRRRGNRSRLRTVEDARAAFHVAGRSRHAMDPIGRDRRHTARRRHRLQHEVGRPRGSVRAGRSSAVALFVPRHDGTSAAAVHLRRHASRASRPRARAAPSGLAVSPRHGHGDSPSSPRAKVRCSRRRISPRHQRARRKPREPEPAGRARARVLPVRRR